VDGRTLDDFLGSAENGTEENDADTTKALQARERLFVDDASAADGAQAYELQNIPANLVNTVRNPITAGCTNTLAPFGPCTWACTLSSAVGSERAPCN
jgi:hypothetical protein